MRFLKKVGLVVSVSALAACASGPQPYHTAQQASQSMKYTVGSLQDSMVADHMHRFLNKEHTVYYMQNQGGGGAALGLLLGPLGVVANIAAIKSETNKDAALLQDKFPIDAVSIFSASLSAASMLTRATQGETAPKLSPVLYVEKLDDEHIRVASMLVVRGQVDGKPTLRQYVYELPESYAKDSLAQGLTKGQVAQLSADAKVGFDWIATTYAQDVHGAFRPSTKEVIHSDFVTPRTQIAFAGYSFDAGMGRVGFALQTLASTTVYSLPKDAAKLTL